MASGIMQEVQEDYILVKEILVERNTGSMKMVNGSDKWKNNYYLTQ